MYKEDIMVSSYRAFSLIELMVVIAIVAALSAAALPAYKTYILRAEASKAAMIMSDITNKLIEAHERGVFNCTSTTFNYGDTVFTVNSGGPPPVTGYEPVVRIGITTYYGPYNCNSNNTIGSVQASINNIYGVDEQITELEFICIVGKSSEGIIDKICGVWNESIPWQVPTIYLPTGYDCILETNLDVKGNQCSNVF